MENFKNFTLLDENTNIVKSTDTINTYTKMKNKTKSDLIEEIEDIKLKGATQINDLKEESLSYKKKISELVKNNVVFTERLHSIDEVCSLMYQNKQLSKLTVNMLIQIIHDLSTVNANNGK